MDNLENRLAVLATGLVRQTIEALKGATLEELQNIDTERMTRDIVSHTQTIQAQARHSTMRPVANTRPATTQTQHDRAKELVLSAIMSAHTPIGSARIREVTGLSKPDIAKPLRELVIEKSLWKMGEKRNTVYSVRVPAQSVIPAAHPTQAPLAATG